MSYDDVVSTGLWVGFGCFHCFCISALMFWHHHDQHHHYHPLCYLNLQFSPPSIGPCCLRLKRFHVGQKTVKAGNSWWPWNIIFQLVIFIPMKKGGSVGMEICKRVLTGNVEIWRGFESNNLLQQNAQLHLRSNIYGNFIASLDYIRWCRLHLRFMHFCVFAQVDGIKRGWLWLG